MEQMKFMRAVEVYQDMVYRTALHFFANPPDAEDAVQEVFLRLYTWEKPFDSPEHLRTQQDIIDADACIHVYPYGAITLGEKGEVLADPAPLREPGPRRGRLRLDGEERRRHCDLHLEQGRARLRGRR